MAFIDWLKNKLRQEAQSVKGFLQRNQTPASFVFNKMPQRVQQPIRKFTAPALPAARQVAQRFLQAPTIKYPIMGPINIAKTLIKPEASPAFKRQVSLHPKAWGYQKFTPEQQNTRLGLMENIGWGYSGGIKKIGEEIASIVPKIAESKVPQEIVSHLKNIPIKREVKTLLGKKLAPITDVNKVQKAIQLATREAPIQPQKYVQQQKQIQEQARQGEQLGLIGKANSFLREIKTKMVEKYAPFESLLTEAERKFKVKVKPTEDIRLQTPRVNRAPSLATQFAKDNGFEDVIRSAPDLDTLDQYMIAKHTARVESYGIKTGRDLVKDKQLVAQLSAQYEPFAQKVTQYSQKLLDYITDSGLIDKNTATLLKQKYPEYVPLNRIFEEIEQPATVRIGRGVASLSKQTVVQKLVGSERAIESPIHSLMAKTLDAFRQGERNKAGKMLASYRELPTFKGLINEVKPGKGGVNSFSYLENGVKRTFETTSEIATAAKNLDAQQFGLLGNIFVLPTRIARLGITGINIPFIISNLAKDQATAFINSNRALRTSVANLPVFGKSLYTAIGHGKLYDDWIRAAGGGTSFDIARSQIAPTVAKIRAGRNIVSKVAYTVTHPADFLRAVESVVSRGEEMTRLQQFIGTREGLLKQGTSLADANILAARQSREATVDFMRSGSWGKVLNSTFLYLNAGIQGSRTLLRNLAQRPIQTGAKIATAVFLPVASITAWNLSDEKRRLAYQDIPDWEKQNSLIIIPPNPTRDERGQWNVIKIPYSQEIAGLTRGVRQMVEGTAGLDYPKFKEFAADLFQTATSLDVSSKEKIYSLITPQAIKAPTESFANKVFFTGKQIVPDFLQAKPKEEQIYKWTSGSARLIAKLFNTSPLKVEHVVKSYLGGVGNQAINAVDRVLAKAGIIPKEQIGGEGMISNIVRRFAKATGGEIIEKSGNLTSDFIRNYGTDKDQAKLYYRYKDEVQKDLGFTDRDKALFDAVSSDDTPTAWESIGSAMMKLGNPKVMAAKTALQIKMAEATGEEVDPLYLLPPEQQRIALTYTASKLNRDDKSALIEANPWLPEYWDIRGQYFDKKGSKFEGYEGTSKYYQPSKQILALQEQYFAYPKGSQERKNFLKQYPELIDHWDKNQWARNQERLAMGLPTEAEKGYSKWGRYKRKGKKPKVFKGPSAKIVKAPSVPKIAQLKVSGGTATIRKPKVKKPTKITTLKGKVRKPKMRIRNV